MTSQTSPADPLTGTPYDRRPGQRIYAAHGELVVAAHARER
jgi:hypothetical protein